MRFEQRWFAKVLACFVAAAVLAQAPDARASDPYGALWNGIVVESTTPPKEATDNGCASEPDCEQNARRRAPYASHGRSGSVPSFDAVQEAWRQLLMWVLSMF